MKNIITFLTAISVLSVLTSCHAYVDVMGQKDYEKFQAKKHVYVLNILTNEDSIIYFSRKMPGIMTNEEVKGAYQILLQDFKPDSVKFKGNFRKPIIEYAIKNGVSYRVLDEDSHKLVYNTTDTTRIPFSDIRQMHVIKPDPVATVILTLGIAAGNIGLYYMVLSELDFSGGW